MAAELLGCSHQTCLHRAKHCSHARRLTANYRWLTSRPVDGWLPARTSLRQTGTGRTMTLISSASTPHEGPSSGSLQPAVDPAVPGSPASDSSSFPIAARQANAGPEYSSSTASPPSSGQPPSPPPPQRGRQTLEQMQREARAKLGDLVRQQLEVERQAGQQPRSTPTAGGATTSSGSSTGASGSGGSPHGMELDPDSAGTPANGGDFRTVADSSRAAAAAGTGPDPAAPQRYASAAASPEGTAATRVAAATQPPPGTDPADDDNGWQTVRQEWAEEWQRVKDRWRQFVERPLEPPRSHRARLEAQQAQHDSSEAADQQSAELRRRAAVSRLVQLACVAVFVAQWEPVVQALRTAGGAVAVGSGAGAATSGKEVLLAVLLASPPTPWTVAWQADAVSLAAGNVGCLLTSSVLHSGLLSLVVSLSSLEETLPWLETLDGFMIMVISYGMAGVATGLAQLCIGGQAAGIAGLGTAVGMEVAVALRCWRYSGRPMPPTPSCVALFVVAALMAVYQPLVGVWGILGGAIGGALSSVLAYDVLYVLRVVLAISILLSLNVWNLLTWLPGALWRVVASMGAFVWGTGVAVVQALRGV